MRIRSIAFAALALVLVAVPSRADIVYTWHETDGQNVTGSLDVQTVALANGQIAVGDVVSFAWSDPAQSFGGGDLVNKPFPVPISTSTGAFTGTTNIFGAIKIVSNRTFDLMVDATAASMTSGGGGWSDVNTVHGNISGTGNWTVVVTTVPEPATVVLAGIAAVVGLGAWARRRRSRHYGHTRDLTRPADPQWRRDHPMGRILSIPFLHGRLSCLTRKSSFQAGEWNGDAAWNANRTGTQLVALPRPCTFTNRQRTHRRHHRTRDSSSRGRVLPARAFSSSSMPRPGPVGRSR